MKWNLYSFSIIRVHHMYSQIQALNLKHIFPCLVSLLHCVNECLKMKYRYFCNSLLLSAKCIRLHELLHLFSV